MILHSDSIFFRSEALGKMKLHALEETFWISDDTGEKVRLTALEDQQQVIYWYRRLKTEVCQTGECRLVDVGLYWDCTGDFYGLEVYGEHLTKTDHTIFLPGDYDRLMSILFNDWSILREYNFSELTTENNSAGVDATSGATRKEIASEAVKNAVYTTYTLWHLVHGGEKEQISDLTAGMMKDGRYVTNIISAGTPKYVYFLLDLLAQSKVEPSGPLGDLVVRGLVSDEDPFMQDLALKALTRADIDDADLQSKIAGIYGTAPMTLKLRLVTALSGLKHMHGPLAEALQKELEHQNQWFALKVLPLLQKGPRPSATTLKIVRKLAESQNLQLKQSANEFLAAFDR